MRFSKSTETKGPSTSPRPYGEEAKPYFVDSFAELQHGRKELEQ